VLETAGGIPDISFIFDTSSSEGFNPLAKDEKQKGSYDLACLGFYSIVKYLESIGLAPMMNFNVINFSSFTKSSGWSPYSDLNRLKRLLFAHQNGATFLDPVAIRKLTSGRKDSFISFMLSDTGFNSEKNAEEIIKEIDLLSQSSSHFHLFQLGGLETKFSNQVKRLGAGVDLINSTEDFMNLSLKFTQNLYGEIAK